MNFEEFINFIWMKLPIYDDFSWSWPRYSSLRPKGTDAWTFKIHTLNQFYCSGKFTHVYRFHLNHTKCFARHFFRVHIINISTFEVNNKHQINLVGCVYACVYVCSTQQYLLCAYYFIFIFFSLRLLLCNSYLKF